MSFLLYIFSYFKTFKSNIKLYFITLLNLIILLINGLIFCCLMQWNSTILKTGFSVQMRFRGHYMVVMLFLPLKQKGLTCKTHSRSLRAAETQGSLAIALKDAIPAAWEMDVIQAGPSNLLYPQTAKQHLTHSLSRGAAIAVFTFHHHFCPWGIWMWNEIFNPIVWFICYIIQRYHLGSLKDRSPLYSGPARWGSDSLSASSCINRPGLSEHFNMFYLKVFSMQNF